MEKVPSKTSEYHKIVWKESDREARHFVFSDKRVMAGNFILAIASEYFTSRFLDVLSNTVTIHPVVHIIILFLGTLVGFVALYGFRLLSNGLWFIPASLYKEKRIVADKLTWNDIEIKLKKFDPNSVFTYGIELKSKKPFIVNHIYAEKTWYFQDYEIKQIDRLPLIYGRQYVWDEGVIDDKSGEVVFSLFNVYRDEPESQTFRAFMPKSGQPNDRECSLDIVSTMQDKTKIEITFSCTVENAAIIPSKIKKNYMAWFEKGKLLVEEYTEK